MGDSHYSSVHHRLSRFDIIDPIWARDTLPDDHIDVALEFIADESNDVTIPVPIQNHLSKRSKEREEAWNELALYEFIDD